MNNDSIYNFIIDKNYEGTRLDLVLSLSMEETSRSYVQKLIENGNVKVNSKVETSKKAKLKENDEVEILIPAAKELEVLPENIPLNILYEDDDVIVINKEKGMVVHPAVGNYTGTLVNALMYHSKDLSSINGIIRPGIVHRIDKDTSGVLVIAKNDFSHTKLSEQLSAHTMNRRYIALCYDNIREESGHIDKPIGRDPSNRLKMAITSINSKDAVTNFKVLERYGKYTLIECKLETGRTHQIRVHMASIKHPLVGDLVYGPNIDKIDTKMGKVSVSSGQMLHAKTLGFVHPRTDEYMEFTTELPKEFTDLLEKLR